MKIIIKSIWEKRSRKYLLLTVAVCAAIMAILLLGGQITIAEMIDLQKKSLNSARFVCEQLHYEIFMNYKPSDS